MNPKVWGHKMWSFLINLALRYPDNFTAQHARQWELLLKQLAYVLPCIACKNHYTLNLKNYPPKTNSKVEVLTWLNKLYNHIGQKNLSFTEFVNKGKTYNKLIFWDTLYYIIYEYPPNNDQVSFDTQLNYKQFFNYLFDMIPLRHIKMYPVDQFLTDKNSLLNWYNIMRNQTFF